MAGTVIDLSTTAVGNSNFLNTYTQQKSLIISGQNNHSHATWVPIGSFTSGKTTKYISVISSFLSETDVLIERIYIDRKILIQPLITIAGSNRVFNTIVFNDFVYFSNKILIGVSATEYLNNFIPNYSLPNPVLNISQSELDFRTKNEKYVDLTKIVPIGNEKEYKLKLEFKIANTKSFFNLFEENSYTNYLTNNGNTPASFSNWETMMFVISEEIQQRFPTLPFVVHPTDPTLIYFYITFQTNYIVQGKYL